MGSIFDNCCSNSRTISKDISFIIPILQPLPQSISFIVESVQDKLDMTIRENKQQMLIFDNCSIGKMNSYRLNYDCLIKATDYQTAKKHFITLANKLNYSLDDIAKFRRQYLQSCSQSSKQNQQALKWAFENNFYWNLLFQITTKTSDPKMLAYLRLPLQHLFQAINSSPRQHKAKTIYVLAQLNAEFIKKLKNINGSNETTFLMFTGFVKGFTNLQKAQKMRGTNTSLITITIANQYKSEYDSGLVVQEQNGGQKQNVIINLFHIYKLNEIESHQQMVNLELQYGFVANKMTNTGNNRAFEQDRNVVKVVCNSNYISFMKKTISSQADMLQMSGYYDESITIHQSKLLNVNQNNKDQYDKCIISKADSYLLEKKYDEALKQYEMLTTEKGRLIRKIRKAQICLMQNEQTSQEGQKIFQTLRQSIPQLEKESQLDSLKARNLIVQNMIKCKKYNSAEKYIRDNLQIKLVKRCFKNQKLNVIPIYTEIRINSAICLANNLNQQRSIKELQVVIQDLEACLGHSVELRQASNLLLTFAQANNNASIINQLRQKLARMRNQVNQQHYHHYSLSSTLQQNLSMICPNI